MGSNKLGNRSGAEKELLFLVDLFIPGSDNKKIYEEHVATLSDIEFDEWMTAIEEETEILAIMAPNFGKQNPTIAQAYVVADVLGYELFQRLKLTDQNTGQVYMTANKHFCGLVPLRRQIQMLEEKRSIPSSSSTVDERSGQASGGAKASRMSGPELQVNASKGLRSMLIELIKFRAGDAISYNAMNRSILETGEASLNSIMADNPGMVKANKTLSIYLTGCQLGTNLAKD